MRHIILVLGCHRSGTSAIAHATQCMGFKLGPRAKWSGPDNPISFGEDQDALALNDALLRYVGSAWDEPGTIPNMEGYSKSWTSHHDRMLIRRFLTNRLESIPLFGLKEPRLCRLLWLWRGALSEIDCGVSVVHAIRHPMAVAASLKTRNDIPIERGLALWLEYTRRARLDVDPAWPAVTVRYERMMLGPAMELSRMAGKLGFPLDRVETNEFLDHFLDGRLQHEKAADIELPPEIAEEWAIVSKEAVT